MWYDLTPTEYAGALRFGADEAERRAAYWDAQRDHWAAGMAAERRRTARRLRAMALLCDRSSAPRAGNVDFLGLEDPRQSSEEQDAAILRVEGRDHA